MKKLVFLFILTIISIASGCPVKKGYIANGVVKDTMHMMPGCGMVSTFRSLFESASWVEAWGVEANQSGVNKINAVIKGLNQQGYKTLTVKDTSKGKVWQMVKGSKAIIVMTGQNDPLIFVAIAGAGK